MTFECVLLLTCPPAFPLYATPTTQHILIATPDSSGLIFGWGLDNRAAARETALNTPSLAVTVFMGGRSPKLSPTLSRATAVQLVVTCAKAKRGVIPLVRHLRSIRQASVTRAAATWIRRLGYAKGESVLAADLYYGDH